MKKLKYLALLVVPMLVGGCSVVVEPSSSSSSESSSSSDPRIIPGLVEKDVELEMISHFNKPFGETTYKDTTLYSDYWFTEDSFKINYSLAVISAMTGAVSYDYHLDSSGNRISAFLTDTGYSNIVKNQYYTTGEKLENSIGGIIGSKKIKDYNGKEYTLLALFPRNAGYGAEWMGNFNIGKVGIHKGFLLARDELLRLMKSYITSNNITGDIKVWGAGYSRGAAAINLVGGFLAEESGYFGNNVKLSPHDLYIYNIGTPMTVPTGISKLEALSVSGPRGEGYHDTDVSAYTYNGKDEIINPEEEKYNCIHNFVAYGDYITKLPPSSFSFTRYGDTNRITYGGNEFVKKLEKLSPDTASRFANGVTYTSELLSKAFDINKIAIIDGEEKASLDALIENHLASLVSSIRSRNGLVDGHYAELLGALVSIYGVDGTNFLNAVKEDTASLIKAGALTYLSYAIKQIGLNESASIGELIKDIVGITGRNIENRNEYTDQDFLKDLFDFLINDYQTSKEAEQRVIALSKLIPAPYGDLYKNVLDYAKKQEIKATYVDDLLLILAGYITENQKDETVNGLMNKLVGLIPEQYDSYLTMVTQITGKTHEDITDRNERVKAIILDVIEVCAKGTPSMDASSFRYVMISFVIPMVAGTNINFPKTLELLVNGTTTYGEKVVREKHSLEEIVEEILNIVMPKNKEGKRLTVKETAVMTLKEILEKGKTDKISKYVNLIEEHIDDVIMMASALLFNPGTDYALGRDINDALTIIDMIQFLFPAHNHEMYISYLQTKLPA